MSFSIALLIHKILYKWLKGNVLIDRKITLLRTLMLPSYRVKYKSHIILRSDLNITIQYEKRHQSLIRQQFYHTFGWHFTIHILYLRSFTARTYNAVIENYLNIYIKLHILRKSWKRIADLCFKWSHSCKYSHHKSEAQTKTVKISFIQWIPI